MFRISWIIWFQLKNDRGARQFPALWHLAERFFYWDFFKKEGFLKDLS